MAKRLSFSVTDLFSLVNIFVNITNPCSSLTEDAKTFHMWKDLGQNFFEHFAGHRAVDTFC